MLQITASSMIGHGCVVLIEYNIIYEFQLKWLIFPTWIIELQTTTDAWRQTTFVMLVADYCQFYIVSLINRDCAVHGEYDTIYLRNLNIKNIAYLCTSIIVYQIILVLNHFITDIYLLSTLIQFRIIHCTSDWLLFSITSIEMYFLSGICAFLAN